MVLHQVAKTHVHRVHAELLTDFNHRFNLVHLVVTNQRTDTRRHVHHLVSHHAATANARHKRLAYHALQHERKLRTYGLLFALRESIHHTVDCLHARVSMERREGQVTRFCNGQSGTDRFKVTHFADKHHVRVLTQRHLKRLGEAVGIATDFTLVDHAALVLVQEFDRVFHRQNVVVTFLVDLVDHSGQGRRLTRTRSTRHQHEAGGAGRELGHNLREAEILKGLDFERDDTERKSHATTLQVGVRTETCEVRDTKRKVTFLLLFESLFLAFVHQAIGHAHGFVRFQLVFANGSELTGKTNKGRRTCSNVQVRGATLDHFRKKILNIVCHAKEYNLK